MGKILKRLLKTVIIVGLIVYGSVIIAKQEITYRKYDDELKKYNAMIVQEEIKHDQLVKTRAHIASNEYVEEVAREKLGLVMPNEIVFIDANI